MKLHNRNIMCLGILGILTTGPALASGFDNTGIGSLNLLFDDARIALEIGGTYLNRNVEYQAKNAQTFKVGTDGKPYNFDDVTHKGAEKAKATPDVWNWQGGLKVRFHDNLDCLGRMLNPGTILEELPHDWIGKLSIVKTELQTASMDAICAVKVPITERQFFRLIAGARYIQTDLNVAKTANVGGFVETDLRLNLQGTGYGYNIGMAYELPEYAIRASVVYEAAIDIKSNGSVTSSDFDWPDGDEIITTHLEGSASSKFSMPQAVEVNLQTGIAPKWLAMLSAKWVNWSTLNQLNVNIAGELPVDDEPSVQLPIDTTRYFNFKDAWTIRAGIGHQYNDKLQLAGAVTWDQGIGGAYSDTWQFSLGGSYKFTENVTWTLGGALAYKTAAKNELVRNITKTGRLHPSGDQFDLSYDASINFGVLTKLKFSF